MTLRHRPRRPGRLAARPAVAMAVASVLLLAGCGGAAAPEAAPDVAGDDLSVVPSTAPSPGEPSETPSEPAGPSGPSVEPSVEPSSEPPVEPSEPSDPATEVVITIAGFEYDMPPSVPPGATVTVVNDDTEIHSVTSKPAGAFDLKVPGGQSATFTAPDAPGEYGVFCIFHGGMTATLVVG